MPICSILIIGVEPTQQHWRGRRVAARCRLVDGGMITKIDLIRMSVQYSTNNLVPKIILPTNDPDIIIQAHRRLRDTGRGVFFAVWRQQMPEPVGRRLADDGPSDL